MPPLSSKLDRKLRAAEESSDESENYEVTDRSSSESVLEFDAGELWTRRMKMQPQAALKMRRTWYALHLKHWSHSVLYTILILCSQTHLKTTTYKHR